MKRKKISKVLLLELVQISGNSFYHVVYFPSIHGSMPHYLIPESKFNPLSSESLYQHYIVGNAIYDYLV